jgi:putative mRNA 3-end processing factor
MNLQFLGGGNEVGRVGIFLQSDSKKILIDYGMTPENPPKYPHPSPAVDNLFLSHAHLDHSGMIPWIVSNYETNIYSTPITSDIAHILFKDALKIADIEGHHIPYTKPDIGKALSKFQKISYGETIAVNGLNCTGHSAGHIPGSLMFEIDNQILVTGDFNTIDTHLLKGAKPVKSDILFLEGTYSGTDHPDRSQLEKEFLERIDDTLKKNGTVIIPAFAVGRAQELSMILLNSGYDIWLDGMGKKIGQIFLNHPTFLDHPTQLKNALNQVKKVYSSQMRKRALKGEIILTTSGMLEGGPVLWYINNIADDPKAHIILTGYQVEGTNGRMLLDKQTINLFGVLKKISCQVDYFDFSAHAGHSQLVQFAKDCQPNKVVIYHSDNPAPLAESISDFAEVIIPQNNEEIEI